MGSYTIGTLTSQPVTAHDQLLAATVLTAIEAQQVGEIGVVGIDPAFSDTAAACQEYGFAASSVANCVLVAGRRDGQERVAACVVLSDSRADVNGTIRRLLDVRKASFLPRDSAVEATGMEYGGITPIGLPPEWPIFIDSRVTAAEVIVLGSGIRGSKLLLPGAVLTRFPGVTVVEGLGRPVES